MLRKITKTYLFWIPLFVYTYIYCVCDHLTICVYIYCVCDHLTTVCEYIYCVCDHLTTGCEYIYCVCDHLTTVCEYIYCVCDHLTTVCEYIYCVCDHLTTVCVYIYCVCDHLDAWHTTKRNWFLINFVCMKRFIYRSKTKFESLIALGVRCSSVVDVRSWYDGLSNWSHWATSHSSQYTKIGLTKAMVCALLSMGWLGYESHADAWLV